MSKKLKFQIEKANQIIDEIQLIISSVKEDVNDSESMTEIWNKVDRMYKDIEALRNKQTATGSKSFSILSDDVGGHTKYLQGIDLPIMVNSALSDNNEIIPSDVCEMHIGRINGKLTVIITPNLIG